MNKKAKISIVLKGLVEAEDDVREGRVAPIQETFGNLRAILLERKRQESSAWGSEEI